MNYPLVILTVVGTLGSIDVLYFHLYRFRLFARPGSIGEEVTHLFRHAIFVALLVLLASGAPLTRIDTAIVVLFAADIVNSAIDVLIERRSREPLGGLPPAEYLVHILSSFGMGVAVTAYILARSAESLPVPTGMLVWQVRMMVAAGITTFAVETFLFGLAVTRRERLAPRATA